MAEVGQGAEQPDRRQDVGGEIEERGGHAAQPQRPAGLGGGQIAERPAGLGGGRRSGHRHAHQQVARMGDRRAGEQPAEVRLPQRHDVADGHRDRRQHRRQPPEEVEVGGGGRADSRAGGLGCHAEGHEPGEHDDAGQFGERREHRGVAGAGPLVDIRGVEVHRHGRQPEGGAHDRHSQGHRQQHRGHPRDRSVGRLHDAGDASEARRAGDPIERGGPVEEHGRGDQRQEEILDRRLPPAVVGPLEAQQHVGRDRDEFEAGEQEHEVVGHAHE